MNGGYWIETDYFLSVNHIREYPILYLTPEEIEVGFPGSHMGSNFRVFWGPLSFSWATFEVQCKEHWKPRDKGPWVALSHKLCVGVEISRLLRKTQSWRSRAYNLKILWLHSPFFSTCIHSFWTFVQYLCNVTVRYHFLKVTSCVFLPQVRNLMVTFQFNLKTQFR